MKQTLKEKYLSGTSTHQDEQQLLALMEKETATTEELALRALLSCPVKPVLPDEAWMAEDESELFDRLAQEQTSVAPRPRRSIRLTFSIMAAAAVLSGIVFLAWPLWQTSPANMTVVYVYGNKIEDPRISMDMMEETMTELFDRPDVETELSVLLNP